MAVSEDKAKKVAEELREILYHRGLNYEEATLAIMQLAAWDLTQLLEETDLHRVTGFLWNWARGIEERVKDVLSKRYPGRNI